MGLDGAGKPAGEDEHVRRRQGRAPLDIPPPLWPMTLARVTNMRPSPLSLGMGLNVRKQTEEGIQAQVEVGKKELAI